MFQVVIIVSNEHGRGRIWNFYPPLFEKSGMCMRWSDFKIYLLHSGISGGQHYDVLVPKEE